MSRISSPANVHPQNTVRELVTELLSCSYSQVDGVGFSHDSHELNGVELRKEQLHLCASLINVLEIIQSQSNESEIRANGDGREKKNREKEILSRFSPAYRRSNYGISIREATANLPSSTISKLPSVLSGLLSNRIEASDLLPGTQDDHANAEAISTSTSAMTISRIGMCAGRLYAALVGMPGGLGSGLIDVGALSALAALVRRWSQECRGRETAAVDCRETGDYRKKQRKNVRSTVKRKKTRKTFPKKCKRSDRTRRTQRVAFELSESSEDEYDTSFGDHEYVEAQESPRLHVDEDHHGYGILESSYDNCESEKQSEGGMIRDGLLLVQSLPRAMFLNEFQNWSPEAKEALIDSLTCALACAAALPGSKRQSNRIKVLCSSVVDTISDALQYCMRPTAAGINTSIVVGSTEKHGKRIHTATTEEEERKRNQTIVFILRGLLPYLSHQAQTPNGHNGKLLAYTTAENCLEGIVSSASIEATSEAREHQGRRSTPSALRVNKKTPKTKTPLRRRSRSLTPGLRASFDRNVASAPSLKKSATPKLIMSMSPRSTLKAKVTAGQEYYPRPTLGTIVGFLQKLSTGNDLTKSEARSRTSSLLKKCLLILPIAERSHFLRFAINLTVSKRSSHRLFAIDLIGKLLLEEWLWRDHGNAGKNTRINCLGDTVTELNDENDNETNQAIKEICGPCPEYGNEEKSLADTMIEVVNERLSDKQPVVRARAAQSIAALMHVSSDGDQTTNWAEPTFMKIRSETPGMGPSKRNASQVNTSLRNSVVSMAGILALSLRRRANSDPKATVKMAAITGLCSLLLFECRYHEKGENGSSLSRKDIDILSRLCRDPSVSTRKAAGETLTKLLEEYIFRVGCSAAIELLEGAWAASVLPLVLDQETTCSARAVDMFSRVVITPIIEYGGITAGEATNEIMRMRYCSSWRILTRISESLRPGSGKGGKGAIEHSLRRVLQDLCKSKTKILMNQLCFVARSSLELCGDEMDKLEPLQLFEKNIEAQRTGVWCVLDALASSSALKLPRKNAVDTTTKNDSFVLGKCLKSASIDGNFVSLCWEKLRKFQSSPDTPSHCQAAIRFSSRACLRVLAELGTSISSAEAQQTAKKLQSLLMQHELAPDLVSTAIQAVVSLTKNRHGSTRCHIEDIRQACSDLITSLYSSCEETLEKYISNSHLDSSNRSKSVFEAKLERAIFTIGETAMVGFSVDEDEGCNIELLSQSKDFDKSELDMIKGLHVKPSRRLVQLIQALLPNHLPTVDGSIAEARTTPVRARALAFITVGKLCLRDAKLAKNSVNMFARELHQSREGVMPNAIVQSNALLVLGDLCVKYTNLADRHLPLMAQCLQSHAPLCINDNPIFDSKDSAAVSNVSQQCSFDMVRKHAALLLSSLLLQDYIKWRGLLFHRFLAATVDDNHEVSKLAEMLLCGPLLSKQPKLFHNNFVEAVFVLNGCAAHPIYDAAATNGDNGSGAVVGFEGVKLSGPAGKERRLWVYRMMLERMTDEEKISITARLAKEVLGGAVQCTGDLSAACTQCSTSISNCSSRIASAMNVISDSLAVLTSPWCRISRSSKSPDEDEEVDPPANLNAPAAAQLAVVKGRLLSKISRKHLIESVLPILCNLKCILEDSQSPLLKDLTYYLVHIYRQYKDEVKELLTGNRTLLQEIEYDTRQFEKRRRQTLCSEKSERIASSYVNRTKASIAFTPTIHPIASLRDCEGD